MADKPSDLVQGTLDMLILKTLALEPMHGYGISVRIEQMSRGVFRLNAGSLFLAIQRLERDGLIDGEWKPSENNRRARYYTLTAKGRKRLDSETREWGRQVAAIGRILEASLGRMRAMSLFRNLQPACGRFSERNQVDRELDEELGTYLEMEAAEKMRQGVSRKDALREVRLERGSLEGYQGNSFALAAGNFLWRRAGRICASACAYAAQESRFCCRRRADTGLGHRYVKHGHFQRPERHNPSPPPVQES